MASSLRELESSFSKVPSVESCLNLGRYYFAHGQFLQAMVICKKGVKLFSNDPQIRLLLAEIYLAQGKLVKANEVASSLWQNAPCAQVAVVLGQLAEANSDRDAALEAYEQALKLDPNSQVALRAKDSLRGQADASLKSSPEVVVSSPESTLPLASEGDAKQQSAPEKELGFTSLQEVFAESSLGVEAEQWDDLRGTPKRRSTLLGFVPGKKGSLRNTLLLAFVLFTASAGVIYWLWAQAQRTQQVAVLSDKMVQALHKDTVAGYHQAIALWHDLHSIDPDHFLGAALAAYAHTILGTEHGVNQSLKLARKLMDELPAKGYESAYAQSAGLQLRRYAGENSQIWEQSEASLKKGGVDPWVVLELFLAKAQLAPTSIETTTLRARLEGALTYQTRAHHLLGWHFFRAGDWSRAMASFERALNNSPEHLGGQLGRAFVLVSTNPNGSRDEVNALLDNIAERAKEAESKNLTQKYRWLRAEISRFHPDPRVVEDGKKERMAILERTGGGLYAYREGRIQLQAKNVEKAMEHLKEAAEMEPSSVEYVLQWVRALALLSKPKEALGVLKTARQRGLQTAALELTTVELQIEAKQSVEWTRLELVKALDGPRLFAKARYLKAMGLRLAGKSREASILLEAYLDALPASVLASRESLLWCELGNAYWDMGQQREAIAAYQLGLELSSTNAMCLATLCSRSKGRFRKKVCESRR